MYFNKPVCVFNNGIYKCDFLLGATLLLQKQTTDNIELV